MLILAVEQFILKSGPEFILGGLPKEKSKTPILE